MVAKRWRNALGERIRFGTGERMKDESCCCGPCIGIPNDWPDFCKITVTASGSGSCSGGNFCDDVAGEYILDRISSRTSGVAQYLELSFFSLECGGLFTVISIGAIFNCAGGSFGTMFQGTTWLPSAPDVKLEYVNAVGYPQDEIPFADTWDTESIDVSGCVDSMSFELFD